MVSAHHVGLEELGNHLLAERYVEPEELGSHLLAERLVGVELTELGEKLLRSLLTSVCRMYGHLRDLGSGHIDAGMVDPDVNIGVCCLIFVDTCGVPFDPK